MQKILLAIFAVIMTFGLCACGKGKGNTSFDSPTTQAATVAHTDTATTTAKAAADEFITSGKSIKITIPKLKIPSKLITPNLKVLLFLTEHMIPSIQQ